MYKIALVGPGNLAHSLVPALQTVGHRVVQVLARREHAAKAFAQNFHIPNAHVLGETLLEEAQIVLLTVRDEALPDVAAWLAPQARPHQMFVHTSGSTDLATLAPLGEQRGVLYPLQMFTRERQVDFSQVPIFVEGNITVLEALKHIAAQLSIHVHVMDSRSRLRLHLGAVIACNFSNHLFRLAEEQVIGQGSVDFSIYQALLDEQLRRVFEFGPSRTQTGPAIRGDQRTMNQHLALLADQPQVADLYADISRMIAATASGESPQSPHS